MKKYIKKFIGIMGGDIAFRLFGFINRKDLLIICYHRVITEKEPIYKMGMCVDIESFDSQMKLLSKFYRPVGEREIMRAIEGAERMPERSVWVTFDDGYKDNYINAYPILKKYKIPATFFVTSGFVNNESFMTWDEIKEIAGGGFYIGAHTVNHCVLSNLSEEDISKEILTSKTEIEKRISKAIISFAYPKGKKTDCVFSISLPALETAGFKLAVTTISGINDMNIKKRLLLLKRVGASYDDSLGYFKFKIGTAGFF